MSGRNGSGRSGAGRSGSGNRSKSGKPRPGTGGYGRRKLEGKGPTPPAEMRPGHPAQRRAAAAARTAARGGPAGGRPAAEAGAPADASSRPVAGPRGGAGPRASAGAARASAGARAGSRPGAGRGQGGPGSQGRGSGSAAEIVAGRNPVVESLRARVPALALHVGPRLDADERIGEAITLAADQGVPVVEAGRSELDRLTGGAIHQGLALRIRPYNYAHADDLVRSGPAGDSAVPDDAVSAGAAPLIVALDGVTDPRNLGAVARSAAAFGANGVLVPVRRSAGVTAGAWKASAGTLARVRVAQTPNLARALASYAQAGLFVVGLDSGGDTEIGSLTLAEGPLVLVIGSEGRGLSRVVAQQCDVVARIPISGAESLNAGVAAGIALYQVAMLRAAAPSAG